MVDNLPRCPNGSRRDKKTGRCVSSGSKKAPKRLSPKKRGCVKQMQKKYTSRNSPPYPAGKCPVGSRRKGNDGTMYEVKVRANNVHYWVKIVKKAPKRSRPKKPAPNDRCVKELIMKMLGGDVIY